MSERIAITRTPVQITDGTNSAHVTLDNGAFEHNGVVEYADSADSSAWHPAGKTINVSPPITLFLRSAFDSGVFPTAVVTTFKE